MSLVNQDQSVASDVRAAYRECERITRQQAKNFSYGIALLPGDKRRALSAVYAFARRVDDIGDGSLPAEQKIAALDRARADIGSLHDGSPDSAWTAPEHPPIPCWWRCATPRPGSRSRWAPSAS